jgi:hypothetical protein
MVATPDTVRGTDQRRRVAAIGAGFGGLTATKALRHAEVNISDVVVFLAYVVNQTPLWLQVIPAIAGLAATIGALIALHVPRTPRRGRASSRTAALCSAGGVGMQVAQRRYRNHRDGT